MDNGILDCKLNMDTAIPRQDGGTVVKDKHAVACQNKFRRITRNAELIGMKVNASKTKQVCVSDSLSFRAAAYIYTGTGEKIGTDCEMKILGFYFGNKPTIARHVEAIRKTFRGRYWLLIHLGQHHFSEEELLEAIIRPIAEYCTPVFHSMLSEKQVEMLERLQSTALRYIYGFGLSYSRMREMSGLQTLRERRVELCDKFARKCIAATRFTGWFPLNNPGRRSRHTEMYKGEYARCDRLKNSPLFYMRRRMNGKEGKAVGKRNERYARP